MKIKRMQHAPNAIKKRKEIKRRASPKAAIIKPTEGTSYAKILKILRSKL